MQMVEIIQRVLETGELPMNLERQMQNLLQARSFTEAEMVAIDQLIEAIYRGAVRAVPDSRLKKAEPDLNLRNLSAIIDSSTIIEQ